MWRRIWGPHPAEAESICKMHHDLVKHTISSGLFLERLLGNYSAGIVALEAYFTDNPEVTAEYVAQRIDDYLSEDTVRRRLAEMARARIVSVRKSGRTIYYTLDPEIAAAAISFLKGEPVILPATQNVAA